MASKLSVPLEQLSVKLSLVNESVTVQHDLSLL